VSTEQTEDLMAVALQMDLVSGANVEVLLKDPSPFPSSYFISMEHSGNGEFWQLVQKLLAAANRTVCKVGDSLQKAGIRKQDLTRAAMRKLLQTEGYSFGILREVDALADLDLSGHAAFLFVRDPRDLIVSMYLATSNDKVDSPSLSTGGDWEQEEDSAAIIRFIRSAEVDAVERRYQRFADFCGKKNVRVFRYEDAFYSWRYVIADLIEKLNLQIPPDRLLAIEDSAATLSEFSNVTGRKSHRIFPEYLNAATIGELEQLFAYPMAFFGYPPEDKPPAVFLDYHSDFLRSISERLSIANAQCGELAARVTTSTRMEQGARKIATRPTADDHPLARGSNNKDEENPGAEHNSHLVGLVEADPELSWRLKPNASCQQIVLGRQIVMEVDSAGCRPVVGQPLSGEKSFAAYGCSVTFGWAIAAEETYCSVLQSMFPDWRIENHGVGGYSGTQNLIQLHRNARWGMPDFVTFGWIPHHMRRNVGDPTWLQLMMGKANERRLRIGSTQEPAALTRPTFPRAFLDQEGVLQYRLIGFPRRDLLGLDTEDFSPDLHYLDLVSLGIFSRASQLVRAKGGHFFVTILQGEMSALLRRMLDGSGIPVLDASVTGKEFTCLPDDGHPNGRAHRIYAEKIRDYLVARSTQNQRTESRTTSAKETLTTEFRAVTSVAPFLPIQAADQRYVSSIQNLAEPDPVLGLRLKPDTSTEIITLGRRAEISIDAAGFRKVVGQPESGRKTLAVYGCSFTFGRGVRDNETFCSLLQSMLPAWRVENHGIPNYCGTQNLLQLQQDCRWDTPNFVTFCWTASHLLRNVADPAWIQTLTEFCNQSLHRMDGTPHSDVATSTWPRASLDRDGRLEFRSVRFPRQDLKGIDWTSFAPDRFYLDLVCFNLFQRAAEIVKEQGGHFFVTTLRNQLSQTLQRKMEDAGIPVVNASLNGPEFSLLPDDPHPNALAHFTYAEKILQYLNHYEASSTRVA